MNWNFNIKNQKELECYKNMLMGHIGIAKEYKDRTSLLDRGQYGLALHWIDSINKAIEKYKSNIHNKED